ncbi:MAG: hypothetical protein U0802_12985 [Candidatus Binatia bacterium]
MRDLTAAEIVAQFLMARRLPTAGAPSPSGQYRYLQSGIHDIVFMWAWASRSTTSTPWRRRSACSTSPTG